MEQKLVLITGASRGIGAAAGRPGARAGGWGGAVHASARGRRRRAAKGALTAAL